MHHGRAPDQPATLRRQHDRRSCSPTCPPTRGPRSELRLEVLPELSPAAHEVLSGLLAFDPEKRMTAAEALEHRWFTETAKKAD
uniref:Protein kinase domain-containing protein n=1 Tax=Oryza brachyantha TaxID=4533 RepID=J3L8M6_ORYBR